MASARKRREETDDGKFTTDSQVQHAMSGPLVALALCSPDAIQRWRNLIGPTRVFEGQWERPETLRARYGLSDTRNGFHGEQTCVASTPSESPAHARFCRFRFTRLGGERARNGIRELGHPVVVRAAESGCRSILTTTNIVTILLLVVHEQAWVKTL